MPVAHNIITIDSIRMIGHLVQKQGFAGLVPVAEPDQLFVGPVG